MHRAAFGILLISLFLGSSLAGCGSIVGSVRSQSLGRDPVFLEGSFVESAFSNDPEGGVRFVLSDTPVQEVRNDPLHEGQMLTIELLWLPKAGATPLKPTGTNATIHHVIISKGEVGVYTGAGFVILDGSPEDETVHVSVRDSSLRLHQATSGFVDLLTPAQLTGAFRSVRDDQKAQDLHRAMNRAARELTARR
ncbi:MAG: hypothetical protein L0Y44_11910 [Phycisphaerales bacterium]|nr:hypothetical protein [Phycisphaerales bacterium]MCI0631344.1 hypothetical protein [Phycisphaerales bacterium]MCI0675120.1 hypothetical protein [Phycisphaerales bacterium]